MPIPSILSERINLLRFPLIIGVVFIHAYSPVVTFSGASVGMQELGLLATIPRYYSSEILARISVPLFYLIAGFLFFYGFKGTKKEFSRKIKSRFKTLVAPYFFWNIITLFIFAIAQSIPTTASYFSGNNQPILSFNAYNYAQAILGINRFPISFQFWFIRDLIILVCLTPLIYFSLRRISYFVGPFLLYLWIFKYWTWPLYTPAIDAACFFYIGSCLGHQENNFSFLDRHGKTLTIAYIAVSILDVLTQELKINHQIHQIGILLGMCSAFYLTAYILKSKKLSTILRRLSPASFFVFAAHQPLLTIIKKLSYRFLQPSSDMEIVALYFFIPVIVILICVISYYPLMSISPMPMKFITGSR